MNKIGLVTKEIENLLNKYKCYIIIEVQELGGDDDR